MQDFSKIIMIEPEFSREFFFHKISTTKATRYHISTRDKDNRYCSFDMQYNFGHWEIINAPKVAEWIMNLENQLDEIITKEDV
jgi:hypothetical protein